MYTLGGVYIDSKYTGMHGFKFIYLTDREYFCRDIKEADSGIYNAFMICKPGNKKLLQSIKQFVKNNPIHEKLNPRQCMFGGRTNGLKLSLKTK
jgi:hypothetical protein